MSSTVSDMRAPPSLPVSGRGVPAWPFHQQRAGDSDQRLAETSGACVGSADGSSLALGLDVFRMEAALIQAVKRGICCSQLLTESTDEQLRRPARNVEVRHVQGALSRMEEDRSAGDALRARKLQSTWRRKFCLTVPTGQRCWGFFSEPKRNGPKNSSEGNVNLPTLRLIPFFHRDCHEGLALADYLPLLYQVH
eukprot:761042-Hanusia_phi.AAC.4